MKYQTINDVIDYEIEPALGSFASDFDEDAKRAIADEAFELTDYGYAQREDVDFWDVVQAHDKEA